MTITLRIATWNVYGARRSSEGSLSVEATVELIRNLRLDILFLQELEFESGSQNLAPKSAALIEAIGLPHFCGFSMSKSQFDSRLDFGVGIAARTELVNRKGILFPNPGLFAVRRGIVMESHDKGLLLCETAVESSGFYIATLHMLPFHMFDRDASDPVYSAAWRACAEELNHCSKGRIIVGGDFNTNDRQLVLSRLSTDWFDAGRGTITRPGNNRSFDDFLYSSSVRLTSLNAYPNSSDHHIVVANFHTP